MIEVKPQIQICDIATLSEAELTAAIDVLVAEKQKRDREAKRSITVRLRDALEDFRSFELCGDFSAKLFDPEILSDMAEELTARLKS